ncbi:MAG: hypothetical protein IT383_15480 [Deltaproteobacteria bacterium]|nr:hypothetical protein [Deltaproteobacteria bacterium]
MRLTVVACALFALATLSSSARADRQVFLGWHASGAFSYQTVQSASGTVVRVCREDVNDVPAGWPEGVSIGPGSACGELPAQVGAVAALEYAKRDLKGGKAEKKSPFGLEVKLEGGEGKSVVVVLDGPAGKEGSKREQVAEVASGDALKIAEALWRVDGKELAVSVEQDKPAKGDKSAPRWVVVVDVSKLLVGGPAGRKVAERAHAAGQALYKKRDWSGAGKKLEEAINADPSFAPARFLRAAAEAQGGVGRSAMIENLSWLKEQGEKDASAKKLLATAKSDSAFDAWIGEPEVRELLGLPKVSTMDLPTRLLERKATWTLQGATCTRPWLTLVFKAAGKAGGTATLAVAESCKGKKAQKAGQLTWKQAAAGTWELELKKPVDGVAFPAKATIVLDESYQQIKLVAPDGAELGTFEPGAARVDDSTL